MIPIIALTLNPQTGTGALLYGFLPEGSGMIGGPLRTAGIPRPA